MDPETSDIEMTLKGNAGIDPTNKPPEISLSLLSPALSYSYDQPTLANRCFSLDFNQPLIRWICKVKA